MTTSSSITKIIKNNPNWQIPSFKIKEFRPKMNSYCVCIFVINEGERIQKQLVKMGQFCDNLDIIIADGGSTDSSLNEHFLKTTGVRTLLTKTGSGKLSAQMRMAFSYAINQGYLGVVVIDGNGKDDLSSLPNFVKLLVKGYDHIQGSRFIKGGRALNTPISRYLAVRLIHSPLISLASGRYHSDTTNGFRAYSRKLLSDKDLNIFRNIFSSYELHYYLAIESSRNKKFKTIETPVTRSYPRKVKTPTKITPIRGNAKILVILLKSIAGQYRNK